MKKCFFVPIIFLSLLAQSCMRNSSESENGSRLLVETPDSPDFLLPLAALRGRDIWLKSAISKFDPRIGLSEFEVDFINVLSTTNRAERFKKWGLLNDPECVVGNIKSLGWDVCPGDAGPEGIWASLGKNDFRDPACDLNEVDLSKKERARRGDPCKLVFGTSTGVIGLRKFPNPKFTKKSKGVSPYIVGMTCGFCHAGYKQAEAPKGFSRVRYEQIHGLAGNQYLTIAGWPAAKRPIYKGDITKIQYREALKSFGDSSKSKIQRFDDLREYVDSFKAETLAQTVGMSSRELLNTADIGGIKQWEKGKNIFQSSCKGCHDASSTFKVSRTDLKSEVCQEVLNNHLKYSAAPHLAIPSLKSIWSRASFMTNVNIGQRFCSGDKESDCSPKDLTVNARIERFESSMGQLLTPSVRVANPILTNKSLEIATKLGLVVLPKGLPVELIETLDHKKYATFIESIGEGANKLTFQQRRSLFEAKVLRYAQDRAFLLKELGAYARCKGAPEWGHRFGSELDASQKLALMSYLKTI